MEKRVIWEGVVKVQRVFIPGVGRPQIFIYNEDCTVFEQMSIDDMTDEANDGIFHGSDKVYIKAQVYMDRSIVLGVQVKVQEW